MKKKFLAMCTAFVLVLGLVACGGGEGTSEPTKAPQATTDSTKATESTDATKAPETTETTDAAKAPETTAPTDTPVPVNRTMYDMTGWKIFKGTVDQPGAFNGSSLVFARSKNFFEAGFMFLNGDGTIGGYFFGQTGVDENTGIYSITETSTGEVAYFKLSGGSDNYVLDLGGLGIQTTLKTEESVATEYAAKVKKVTTNVTAEFLIELAKIKEGLVEDGYYYGVMDTGELVYYARTENNTYRGLLITSANREDIVVVWGYYVADEATQTEIIMDSTGYELFYQVMPVNGGYTLQFANGAMGTVTVTGCSEQEFMDAMDYAYKESINNRLEEFVNGLKQ